MPKLSGRSLWGSDGKTISDQFCSLEGKSLILVGAAPQGTARISKKARLIGGAIGVIAMVLTRDWVICSFSYVGIGPHFA